MKRTQFFFKSPSCLDKLADLLSKRQNKRERQLMFHILTKKLEENQVDKNKKPTSINRLQKCALSYL